MYYICELIRFPDTEQWKLDFKEVAEKQQQQVAHISQDAAAGVLNRANLDNALGAMIHPPGNNLGRSMQIEAINARVTSQGGHVIARERRDRETGIIPQVMPVARGPAVIPAAINPDAIVNVQQRRPALNQIEDDPVIAAFLRGNFSSSHAAAAPVTPPSANFKVQQEARSFQLQNLISQHDFATKLPANFPEKEKLCETIAKKIVGFDKLERQCCICQEELPDHSHTAKLPCCMNIIHTNCLLRIPEPPNGRPKQCPLCRHDFFAM
jgi:hypothetical protein